ncbi:hypothetical protein [Paraburkholderia flagellata]|nr:hypothetical protein [Paraburkholderia flagellata]
MFLFALPALGTILETVVTVVISTVAAEVTSDAYRALTSSDDQDQD